MPLRRRTPLALLAATVLLALAACSVPTTASLDAVATRPETPLTLPTGEGTLAAFYGDSFTYGAAATSPSLRWSTLLSEKRGWREYNAGVLGLGFLQSYRVASDRVERIVEAHPDVVMVMLGINDLLHWGDLDHATLHARVDADLTELRAGLPDARIVVVEPMWSTTDRPAALFELAGWERDAAATVHAEYIAGASLWLTQRPGLVSDDGLHPNDAGHAYIAERIDEALGATKP